MRNISQWFHFHATAISLVITGAVTAVIMHKPEGWLGVASGLTSILTRAVTTEKKAHIRE